MKPPTTRLAFPPFPTRLSLALRCVCFDVFVVPFDARSGAFPLVQEHSLVSFLDARSLSCRQLQPSSLLNSPGRPIVGAPVAALITLRPVIILSPKPETQQPETRNPTAQTDQHVAFQSYTRTTLPGRRSSGSPVPDWQPDTLLSTGKRNITRLRTMGHCHRCSRSCLQPHLHALAPSTQRHRGQRYQPCARSYGYRLCHGHRCCYSQCDSRTVNA